MKILNYLLLIISFLLFNCTSHVNEYLKKSLLIGDYELAQYYVDNGANVNQKVGDNLNLLSDAILQGNFDKIKFLVKNGADVNVKVKGIPTYFYIFKSIKINSEKQYQIFRYLLRVGASLDSTDLRQNSCAHYSVVYNAYLIANYLYRTNKALFYKKNLNNKSAIEILKNRVKKQPELKKLYRKFDL